MYVFDTTLEPKTFLSGGEQLQRLIFRLPDTVMATVRRDRRHLLKTRKTAVKPCFPWDDEGRVCFSYSGKTTVSTPVFADRRDAPLGSRALKRIRSGCRVRLTMKQVLSRQPHAGTRLQVLKVQVLHLDAPHEGGLALSLIHI